MKIQDLMKAWDEAVERATSDTARESELGEGHLNAVAGMSVQSGVKGGGGSNNTCANLFTCNSNNTCAFTWCDGC